MLNLDVEDHHKIDHFRYRIVFNHLSWEFYVRYNCHSIIFHSNNTVEIFRFQSLTNFFNFW
jgi:hypothetical protein